MTTDKMTAWLFPGQGSQEVGMGRRLLKNYPNASSIFKMAEEFSGQPILDVMSRGPDQRLAQSEILQPALVALSCCYIEVLKMAGRHPGIVAGHSLGELPALYAAEVLTLQDVIRLACERGKLMSQGPVGGMVSVKHCDQATLESILASIETGVACLANINAPTQLIVSGDEEGLAAMTKQVVASGGETQRLNVSGAWHSPLVGGASYQFSKALNMVHFSTPRCLVAMSSTARVETSGDAIKTTMLRQMASPVLWYQTVELVIAEGYREFYEVGCGKILKGLMRRIVSEEKTPYSIHLMETGTTLKRVLKSIETEAAASSQVSQ